MLLVVSDTSPLRALGHLGLLNVVGALYQHVLIPPAVELELRQTPKGMAGIDLSKLVFVTVRRPSDQAQVNVLLETLDPGESEALALALEVRADAVLID